MIKIIKTDSTEQEFKPADKKISLKEMQEIVGGYIEIVPLNNDKLFVCNEEGKIKGLPYNSKASEYFEKHTGHYDKIAGDVIIADTWEID